MKLSLMMMGSPGRTRTSNGTIVGQFTLEGTLFLVLGIGRVAAPATERILATRSALPLERPIRRRSAAAAIVWLVPAATRLRDRGGRLRMIGFALAAAPAIVGGFFTLREMVGLLSG